VQKNRIGNNHFPGETAPSRILLYLHIIRPFDVTTREKLVAVPSVRLLQRPVVSFEVDSFAEMSISFKKDKSHSPVRFTRFINGG